MFEDKEEKGREEIIDYALKLSRAGLILRKAKVF